MSFAETYSSYWGHLLPYTQICWFYRVLLLIFLFSRLIWWAFLIISYSFLSSLWRFGLPLLQLLNIQELFHTLPNFPSFLKFEQMVLSFLKRRWKCSQLYLLILWDDLCKCLFLHLTSIWCILWVWRFLIIFFDIYVKLRYLFCFQSR